METEEKANLIHYILTVLAFNAKDQKKFFDYGDLFIKLIFMSDNELEKIARLCSLNK